MFKEQFDWLYAESATSGRFMNIGLHPHVIGQPYRVRAIRDFIRYAKQFDGVWFATREEIADVVSRRTTQPHRAAGRDVHPAMPMQWRSVK